MLDRKSPVGVITDELAEITHSGATELAFVGAVDGGTDISVSRDPAPGRIAGGVGGGPLEKPELLFSCWRGCCA